MGYFSTERVGAVPVLILCSHTKRLSELASSITSRGLTATAVDCASTVESVYHWLVAVLPRLSTVSHCHWMLLPVMAEAGIVPYCLPLQFTSVAVAELLAR